MTVQETAVLMGILEEAYPRFYADKDDDAAERTVRFWAGFLSDTPLEIATLALQRLIVTCKFPPTVAEMRESIAAVQYAPMPDAGEAWAEVNRAISQYGYYRPEEGIASLSEMTRAAVQRMGWRELCTAPLEHEMANRAHFLKIYGVMEKRINDERLLPPALKDAIANIGQTMPEQPSQPAITVIELQHDSSQDDPFYKEFINNG